MKLTKSAVERATYKGNGQSRCVLWDDALPGFGLRVYPSGRKSFVVFYRAGTRQRFMVLGRFGILTVQEARAKARKALVAVRDGEDPLEERQSAAQADSVEAFCDLYMARHAKPRKRTWREDERRIRMHILPAIGNRKLGEVRRADVAALHSKIGEGHRYEANRVLALLSVIFSCAQKWGALADGAPNPAQGVDKFKERSRDRWVKPEELPRLAEAIDKEGNVYVSAALWLYLLTGARKAELLRAKWEHLDLERAELRLPETKTGETRYVPLSAPALEIIRSLPRQVGNPYLLPSIVRRGRHLVNIEKPWRRVRKAAGCADVRLHDLRRTVGSWLATSGHSLPLIGKILGHREARTTQIYARLGEDVAKQALEDHGARIIEAAGRFTQAS